MGLGFLWFAPDGNPSGRTWSVIGWGWGTVLNIFAIVFCFFAGLDVAITATERCPSVKEVLLGLCGCAKGEQDPKAKRLGEPRKLKLYEGGIESGDLCQGQVGDCWLVAAIASAAEHPNAIRNVFRTKEANERGEYKVHLFHPVEKRWVVIVVDDRFPCKQGTRSPLFMQQVGDELWAILLEKAVAKLAGSWSALSGGFVPWGWYVLTGDFVFQVKRVDGTGKWERLNIDCGLADGHTDAKFYKTEETFTSDQLWNLVLAYLQNDSILGAGGVKKNANSVAGGGLNNEAVNEDVGLVEGHAYSIIDAKELGLIPGLNLGGGLLGQKRLIKVRNPWGAFEWKGAWSKSSKEWDENPLVRAALRPKNVEDGSFWMEWNDFQELFSRVDFCDRTTKFDIALEVSEDMGPGGVFFGCLNGLMRFWLFLQGFIVIYCGRESTGKTLSPRRAGLQGCLQWCGIGSPAKTKDVELKTATRDNV